MAIVNNALALLTGQRTRSTNITFLYSKTWLCFNKTREWTSSLWLRKKLTWLKKCKVFSITKIILFVVFFSLYCYKTTLSQPFEIWCMVNDVYVRNMVKVKHFSNNNFMLKVQHKTLHLYNFTKECKKMLTLTHYFEKM